MRAHLGLALLATAGLLAGSTSIALAESSKFVQPDPDTLKVETPPKELTHKDVGHGCRTALLVDPTTGLPYFCCPGGKDVSEPFKDYCSGPTSRNPTSVFVPTDHKDRGGCTRKETLWACIWPTAMVRGAYAVKCGKGKVALEPGKAGPLLVCHCGKDQPPSNRYSFARRRFIQGECTKL